MKLSLKRTQLAVAIAALAGGSAALAADTDTLTVTATVQPTCAIETVNNLAFGDVLFDANTDQSTTIDVFCNTATGTLTLNGGTNGDLTGRVMSDGANNLPYQLYTDAARTTVFGDGTGSTDTVTVTGSQTVTVYGRVTQADAQAATPSAGYTDDVTVTISP
jgi:spore coat protein U-like protein